MIYRPRFELKIRGRKVSLGERTLIMGVLNVTPDSFSDGGLYFDPQKAIRRGLELARQGVDWIDIGGESTRPGSRPIAAEEEARRVLPVIVGLRRALQAQSRRVPISIDTTKAEVAERAVRAGASIINDVSGLRFDARIAEVARRRQTPLVLMHLRGRPETMQAKPFARDIWSSLRQGLRWSVRTALARGVRRSQLIVDPGLGFGKTRRQNFEILAGLARLRAFRLPVLVGASRKSFVQAMVAGEGLESAAPRARWPLTRSPEFRALENLRGSSSTISRGVREIRTLRDSLPLLIGNAAGVVAAILGGAHIVRVHDVAPTLAAAQIADAILSALAS